MFIQWQKETVPPLSHLWIAQGFNAAYRSVEFLQFFDARIDQIQQRSLTGDHLLCHLHMHLHHVNLNEEYMNIDV